MDHSSCRVLARKSLLLLFCLLVFLAPSIVRAQKAREDSENKTGASLPSLTAAKECLKEARSAECLDNLFREALKDHPTADVLQVIQRFEAEDPEFGATVIPSSMLSVGRRFGSRAISTTLFLPATRPAIPVVTMERWNAFSAAMTSIRRPISTPVKQS